SAITLHDGSDRGRFTVRHVNQEGVLLARFSGDIDCLVTEGQNAVVTGIITDAETPGLPEGEGAGEGMLAGIVIQDGGEEPDRMAWAFGPPGPTCADLSPVAGPLVQHGNFVVR